MLWTFAVVFAVAWLFGLVTGNTMGGLVHVLVLMAVVFGFLAASRGRAVERRRRIDARVHKHGSDDARPRRAGGRP